MLTEHHLNCCVNNFDLTEITLEGKLMMPNCAKLLTNTLLWGSFSFWYILIILIILIHTKEPVCNFNFLNLFLEEAIIWY